MYNEPERESVADPDVTIGHIAERIIKVLLWVKPEIRYKALQRVDQHFRTGRR